MKDRNNDATTKTTTTMTTKMTATTTTSHSQNGRHKEKKRPNEFSTNNMLKYCPERTPLKSETST